MEATKIWTIKATLDWTCGYLTKHNCENARLSAEWLLSHVLDKPRVWLYTNFDRPLSRSELAEFKPCIIKRAKGMPLQYITGTTQFRYINLKVKPEVLIPRPETEVLVSCALDLLDTQQPTDEQLLVADICTGSGCIACSIAHERPNTQVYATDISPEAVALATENASELKLCEQVNVLQGNLGEAIPKDAMGKLNLVVSNPPYVPTGVLSTIPNEVANFEPALALDGGTDGNKFVRKLLPWAKEALKPGGAFAFELFERNLEAAKTLACEAGFVDVQVHNDLADKPRVLTGKKYFGGFHND